MSYPYWIEGEIIPTVSFWYLKFDWNYQIDIWHEYQSYEMLCDDHWNKDIIVEGIEIGDIQLGPPLREILLDPNN